MLWKSWGYLLNKYDASDISHVDDHVDDNVLLYDEGLMWDSDDDDDEAI